MKDSLKAIIYVGKTRDENGSLTPLHVFSSGLGRRKGGTQ